MLLIDEKYFVISRISFIIAPRFKITGFKAFLAQLVEQLTCNQ